MEPAPSSVTLNLGLSDRDVERIALAIRELGITALTVQQLPEPWSCVKTREDAAERLGCSAPTLDKYIADGLIHPVRHGRALAFDIDDLRALAARLKARPS